MISLAIQQFLARWQRSLAVFIAVVLGVSFFAIALLAGGPLNHNLRLGVGQQINGADIVVTTDSENWSENDLQKVLATDGVQDADLFTFSYADMNTDGTEAYLLITDTSEVAEVRNNIDLKSGTWPQNSGEIVVSERKMDESGLQIGMNISIRSWSSEHAQTFTIVGVSESPSGLASGRADGFLSPTDYLQLVPDPIIFGIRVVLDETTSIEQGRNALESSLGTLFTVQSYNDFVDSEVSQLAGSAASLQVALGAFAVIALIASGIVIANSFEISIAQRIREIGLLRSVGASNRQVSRLVMIEALVVGMVASVAGVMLAFGVMTLAGRLLWANGGSTGLELTPVSLIVPIALGILVTILSALGPARGAMRVHPLQAIRQSDASTEVNGASRKRTAFAAILFAVGALVMVGAGIFARNGGAESGLSLVAGIFGGALTFFAILMSAQVILPIVARGLGAIASQTLGVSGELATGNLSRNPRRTASAAAALLMGVTLMTMMTVGASTVKSTIVGEVQNRQPIDLGMRTESQPGGEVNLNLETDRWATIEGVDVLVTLRVEDLTFGDSQLLSVVAVDPAGGNAVLRSEGLKSLTDNTIVISDDTASSYGFADGDQIGVSGSESTTTLEVRIARTGASEPVVSTATMLHLNGEGPVAGAWIKLESGTSVGDVVDRVRAGLPESVDIQVGGGASERESTLQILDTLLLVVVGLLAASVVIAVVGIGNTLTLSVIERTRESGILRAMGLKRGQVRTMLALEGAAISLIGAIVGLLLGVGYGFAGVMTLFGDSLDVTYSIPWAQLGLISLVAVASGLLASVLPARRALAVKPVEALSNIG